MGSRENPFSAPYRRLRAALLRIENPRLRGAASFALLFALSLAVGRAFEVVLSDENVKAAEKVQAGWIATLKTFAPLALIKGYADDVSKVMAGELVYVPPPPPRAPIGDEQLLAISDNAAQLAACNLARVEARTPSGKCTASLFAGLSRADCLAHPEKPGCAEVNACAEEVDSMFDEPPECVGLDTSPFSGQLSAQPGERGFSPPPFPGEPDDKGVPIHFAPFFAIFRSITRLIGENGVAPFVAVGQIVLGTLAFLAITHVATKGAHVGFDNWIANLVLAPLCIVGLASLSAFAIQWLMIGALAAFSWATGLAAACCGTTSIGAGVWYCLKKLGEAGVQHALTAGAQPPAKP